MNVTLEMNPSYMLLIIVVLLLTSCSENLTRDQQTYKEYCAQTNGMWMKMSEMKDGKVIGPSCYGCMPDDKNHVCTQQEYEALLR